MLKTISFIALGTHGIRISSVVNHTIKWIMNLLTHSFLIPHMITRLTLLVMSIKKLTGTAVQKIHGIMQMVKLRYRKILVVIIVLGSVGFILYNSSSGIYDIFLHLVLTHLKSKKYVMIAWTCLSNKGVLWWKSILTSLNLLYPWIWRPVAQWRCELTPYSQWTHLKVSPWG